MSNPTVPPERAQPWPLVGYAPGGYMCKCAICEAQFEGDKRAVMCLDCAASAVNTELEHLRERVAVMGKALEEIALTAQMASVAGNTDEGLQAIYGLATQWKEQA